jgi:hypothetical protein
MDQCKAAILVCGLASTFSLQNAPDRKVQQVQVQQIWQPIRQGSKFCFYVFSQELLRGPGDLGWC